MKIAIDPGHGMSNRITGKYDPGAVSAGVSEADIALTWALTGKWILNDAGIQTFMIRDDDTDSAPVESRDNRATVNGCDRMISIHCNSSLSASATGTESFYRTRDDHDFAEIIHGAALIALKLRDRGIKSEGQSQHPSLAVLDFPRPNMLLELGFISNPGDRRVMLSRDVRVMFWQQVVKAL